MKKKLFLLVLMLMSLTANAAVLIDGICYNLSGSEAVVTSGGEYAGNIVIPSTVIYEGVEYNVRRISNRAFRGCSDLISISIPNSVISIGASAFLGCSGLTSVHISDIAAWCNLQCDSNPLDYAQHLYLNGEEITELEIPNTIETIRDGAFKNCQGLTSVSISNSVTSIGGSVFSGCSNLTSVAIGNGVTNISSSAFYGCSNLTKVELDCNEIVSKDYNQWGSIYPYPIIVNIFGTQVKEYILGESVTSIGLDAFYSSNNLALTSITIPKTMTKIPDSFYNCPELYSVNITDLEAWSNISGRIGTSFHLYLNGEEVKEYVVPNNMTSIETSIFSKCVSLTSITISDQVTNIGSGAFLGCSGLTSLTIPNSVTSIGGSAFSGCSGLTSLTLSNSITSIEKSTFEGCSGLTSVAIPNGVTSIGSNAFIDCSGLVSVVIPNSVTNIGAGAFRRCSSLTSITIPNSVTSIGENALYDCSSLTSMTISCEVVDYWYSEYVSSSNLPPLTDIIFGEGVKTIKDNAFKGFVNVKTIDIASTVTSIGTRAFSGYDKLADVTCRALTVPETDRTVFENSYPDCANLHVPATSLSAYQATVPWSYFKSITAMEPTGITLPTSTQTSIADSYDLTGRRISQPQRGLNIIRMKDGTTRKILKK